MDIQYTLFDPTGNITALVSTPVFIGEQPRIATEIMKKEPTVEQVGFLAYQNGVPSLRMAGGEFCGNASLSAATFFCRAKGITLGETRTIRLRVSGANAPVCVTVRAEEENLYRGTVTMPPPTAVEKVALSCNGKSYSVFLVTMPGISHIITETSLAQAEAEECIKEWCAQLGAEGLGIMQYDPAQGRMLPLVYVPAANTLFWENSCASGTTALGAYRAKQQGVPLSLAVKEPGGILHIAVTAQGEYRLSGQIGERESKTLTL